MCEEAYDRYLASVDVQIDDGPVLGYHILAATWKVAHLYSPKSVFDAETGYRILAEQSTRRLGFMIHAAGTPIDPREEYKDFTVSNCYTFESTRPDQTLLRETAESFGQDVLSQLATQRLLEPPPLEVYLCPYAHHMDILGYDKFCTWNEKTGGYECKLDGYVEPRLIKRRLVVLFDK